MPGLRSSIGEPRAFRALTDAQLYALEPDNLLAYIARAKRSGAVGEARTGVHMLLFHYEARIRNRVRVQLPRHLQSYADVVADWVIERLTRSALKLQLEGESVGEWVNWTETTIRRQVISFWRTSQGQALEHETMLPAEHEGEEGVQDTIGTDVDEDGVVTRLDANAAIRSVFNRMDNAMHVAVVRSAFGDDLPSIEVARVHGTTPANVDQIKSRFRRELREELEVRGMRA